MGKYRWELGGEWYLAVYEEGDTCLGCVLADEEDQPPRIGSGNDNDSRFHCDGIPCDSGEGRNFILVEDTPENLPRATRYRLGVKNDE